MSTIMTVPAELIELVRVGLYECLADAAEETIDAATPRDRERHPERFLDARRKFERTWALLDQIGWTEPDQPKPAQIDLSTHRESLTEALDVMQLVSEDDLEEADRVDAERAGRGEPPQRDLTVRRVSRLREFALSIRVRRHDHD